MIERTHRDEPRNVPPDLKDDIATLIEDLKSMHKLLALVHEKFVGCCGFFGPFEYSLMVLIHPCSEIFQREIIDGAVSEFNGKGRIRGTVKRHKDEVYLTLSPYELFMKVVILMAKRQWNSETLNIMQAAYGIPLIPFTLPVERVVDALQSLVTGYWSLEVYKAYERVLAELDLVRPADEANKTYSTFRKKFEKDKSIIMALHDSRVEQLKP